MVHLSKFEAMKYDDEFDRFMMFGEKLGLRFTFIAADNHHCHCHCHCHGDGGFVSNQESYGGGSVSIINQLDRETMIERFKDGSVDLRVSAATNHRDDEIHCRRSGLLIKATEIALVSEHERMQRCKDLALAERNRVSAPVDEAFLKFLLSNKIQQIRGTESIKPISTELIDILKKSPCPRFITNSLFAKQILASCCERGLSFYNGGFAPIYAQVIVLVTSKVPHAMDFFLAELHKLCIYSVPKHIDYSESAFESVGAFYQTVGYNREQDGRIENDDKYLERLANYMRLYGALVQTEQVDGEENSHGVMHGWAWLVSFLMGGLPANACTAVALEAFLSMAGYKLHKKYKIHFRRWLNDVSEEFLDGLRTTEEDQKAVAVVAKKIQNYIEGEEFLQEPEGWMQDN